MTCTPHARFRGVARLVLAALVAAGCSARPAPPAPDASAPRARNVVIISVDGLRPDAIEAAGATNLRAMMRQGAWTHQARTIVPSRTLPSHASMLTGVEPAVHGLTWNTDRTEERGTVRVPTVFDVARDGGRGTAAFMAKAKLRHLIHPGAPERVIAPRGNEVWLSATMVEEVERHLRYRRPELVFVHLSDPDISGHAFGWMSAPYRWGVRRADAAVGRIRDAAMRAYEGDVVVIVTADHGGHGRDHGTEQDADVLIPWIAWGRGVTPGRIAGPVCTYDTAATAVWLLGLPVPEGWAGRPVAEAFSAAAR